MVIGGTGLAFYAYREFLARHFVPLLDYQVQSIREVGAGIAEIALVPLGRPAAFAPGQFAMLFLEGKDGWHRHPFTITSSPQERVMRFAIKALGDETSQLLDVVRPGVPAVIGGPFGRFSHEKGTSRQLWIVGGIGVTPFPRWLRALDTHPLRGRVDFFYTSASANPPYAAGIRALADRRDLVHVHFVNSGSQDTSPPSKSWPQLTEARTPSLSSCAAQPACRCIPGQAGHGTRGGKCAQLEVS